jgi:N6-adenosine-specific RNA methylase IME4
MEQMTIGNIERKIIIDQEIKALIPPISPEEYKQLETNILTEGCRDSLVVWNGILLDGHNRLSICERYNISYNIKNIEFDDRDAAKLWVYENQLGRRNLTTDQTASIGFAILELRTAIEKKLRAQKAGEKRVETAERKPDGTLGTSLSDTLSDKLVVPSQAQAQNLGMVGEVNVEPKPKIKKDSRASVAKELNIPERKLRDISEIAKTKPEVVKEIANGTITIAQAKREIKREETINKLEDIKVKEAKAVEGVYDVLVIDPPWPMQKIERDVRPNQSEFDYPTMTEEELNELHIPSANDCHVWLWTTHKFLPMAFRLLEEWNLKYVCTFVWHKAGGFQPIGLPQYNCEFVLYARKGTPKFVDTKAFPVCFEAPRGAHSEKPKEFYELVNRVTAGRRLDMFSRRKIDGFDSWGNEVV